MSFLDDIRSGVAEGFDGLLHTGTIRRQVLDGADDFGDPQYTATDLEFQGCFTNISAQIRVALGVPETDIGILVILGLTDAEFSMSTIDDLVLLEGQWHKLRKVVSIDPARASATLSVYEIDAPDTES